MKEKNEHAQAMGRLGGQASAKKRWGDKTPEQISEAMRQMRKARKETQKPETVQPVQPETPEVVQPDTNGTAAREYTKGDPEFYL